MRIDIGISNTLLKQTVIAYRMDNLRAQESKTVFPCPRDDSNVRHPL